MLRELLLTLQGDQGNTFCVDQQQKVFKVNSFVSGSLFHPAEVSLVEGLLTLATDLARIKAFVAHHRAAAAKQTIKNHMGQWWNKAKHDFELRGLYADALCDGLDESLQPYLQEVDELAKYVLQCGDARLTDLIAKLLPFQPVMDALCNLIRMIYVRKVKGCFILDLVYRETFSGYPNVEEAMKRILHEGHKVLYKQLLTWILQGRVFDPHQEFFIVEEGLDEQDGNNSLLIVTHEESKITHSRSKSKLYCLHPEMVPGHISLELAEKIFFVGESIQLIEADRKVEARGTVLGERETEFYKQLSSLRDEKEFRISNFEQFVDNIRTTASKDLHSLFLERADLRSELVMARNVFFLGRGDIFHSFILNIDSYLQKLPTDTTTDDVNRAFLMCCRGLITNDDDGWIKKIKFVITPQKAEKEESSVSKGEMKPKLPVPLIGWRCLSLQYAVLWPLHLIFTEKILSVYNKVFQFLINVRRTELNLSRLWMDQRKMLTSKPLLRLRTHMIHMIGGLSQYMYDNVETEFENLKRKLDQSTNFEEVRVAHEVFIDAVAASTFVNNKPVYQRLCEMLSICLLYCRQYSSCTLDEKSISSLCLQFGRQSALLFDLLKTLSNHHSGGLHLTELLMRIDFNKYFSKHGHDVGRIT